MRQNYNKIVPTCIAEFSQNSGSRLAGVSLLMRCDMSTTDFRDSDKPFEGVELSCSRKGSE